MEFCAVMRILARKFKPPCPFAPHLPANSYLSISLLGQSRFDERCVRNPSINKNLIESIAQL